MNSTKIPNLLVSRLPRPGVARKRGLLTVAAAAIAALLASLATLPNVPLLATALLFTGGGRKDGRKLELRLLRLSEGVNDFKNH